MRLDSNPLFRKATRPWYDGNIACWLLLLAMLMMVLFSWAGLYVACTHPFYDAYLWVPMTILVLSILVGGSVVLRLVRRYLEGYRQNRDL